MYSSLNPILFFLKLSQSGLLIDSAFEHFGHFSQVITCPTDIFSNEANILQIYQVFSIIIAIASLIQTSCQVGMYYNGKFWKVFYISFIFRYNYNYCR